nr:MAG TPA: hypothetical protein [Caudoviricetes sp.]
MKSEPCDALRASFEMRPLQSARLGGPLRRFEIRAVKLTSI